ncbi:UbiA family prenyltransferase [Pararhizobium sp.]|uniref:UbiA family prenyltransferase n=1 Tax=Pararhizobium sp. TaxID=1977563 RepID=UPI00271FB835|nr:UbiA family prenyltransferase [Pararhizobium sp.]MDO9417100.1 UbiA family prenyltransferase [Pararhizobium sp.]
MDTRTDISNIPLCVDLDGTLLATDTLWEGAAVILLRNPLLIFPMLMWMLKGKAVLKHEVAKRSRRLAEDWVYRDAVIARLRVEKENGRKIFLVTGAAESVALGVLTHLDVFSGVIHSSATLNLTGSRKRDALVSRFGEGGFDYIGNSRDDIPAFDSARHAIVVAPDSAASKWQKAHDSELLDTGASSKLAVLKSIRVHQWAKNVLIGVPVVLNHDIANVEAIVHAATGFFAFSFLASAVYIINDLSDLTNDRRHPKKKKRPLASGQMSVPIAAALALSLIAASLALTLLLPLFFAGVLAFYAVATTAYTFVLKRKLLVDVFTLAGLYTVRIVAGAAATGAELSFWLLSFSIFFFLSLALVKRYVELNEYDGSQGDQVPGRGYVSVDYEMVGQAGVASAFTSAMVLALYIHSKEMQEMYTTPWALWPLCPLVLYMLLRIWMLARRSLLHEDPVVFIMRDWRSQVTMVIGAGLVLLGTF